MTIPIAISAFFKIKTSCLISLFDTSKILLDFFNAALNLIKGTVAPKFLSVKEVFTSLWNEIEVGAGLSIFLNNELVVDLWGGHTDRNRTIEWQQDTLVNTYSISKGIVSLAIACLVDEKVIDYQNPVSDYWPQFGAERKSRITVAQALSHQAGVYTFYPSIKSKDLYDWLKITLNIASQRPSWEPATAFGYHSITWGFIAGEIIRQVTGESVGHYIRRRITEPLSSDFYIGLTATEQGRCAEIIGPNHARSLLEEKKVKPDKILPKNDPILAPYRIVSSPEWRSAQIPASNGHGSSLGIAKCYQAAISHKIFPKILYNKHCTKKLTDKLTFALANP